MKLDDDALLHLMLFLDVESLIEFTTCTKSLRTLVFPNNSVDKLPSPILIQQSSLPKTQSKPDVIVKYTNTPTPKLQAKDFTLQQLKFLCESYGLKVSGNKGILLQRIIDNDKNGGDDDSMEVEEVGRYHSIASMINLQEIKDLVHNERCRSMGRRMDVEFF